MRGQHMARCGGLDRMRVLRALIKSRGGAIGEYWREVNLSGFPNGYNFGPRPNIVYAFGFWWACAQHIAAGLTFARIWKSADALTWTVAQDVFSQTGSFSCLSASFSDGFLIFTGHLTPADSFADYGFVILSQDGENWNYEPQVGTDQIIKAAGSNGANFLALSQSGNLFRSTDFANWTLLRGQVASLAQGVGKFVCSEEPTDPSLSYSTNGLTWVPVSTFAGKLVRKVNFSGGKFWAQSLEAQKSLWWSDDGVAWYQATVPAAYTNGTNAAFSKVAYADGIWLLWFTKENFSQKGALISTSGNAWQDVSELVPNIGTEEFSEGGPFFFAPYGYNPQTAYVSP